MRPDNDPLIALVRKRQPDLDLAQANAMADEWWAQYGDGLHDLGELAAVLWEVVLHRGHVVVRILKGFVVNDAIVAEALAALPELRERIAAATNAEPLNPVALREFLRELMSLGRVDP